MTNHTSYFTVAHIYVRTRKYEFCTGACTFAARLFGNDYLPAARKRVKLRMDQLTKRG